MDKFQPPYEMSNRIDAIPTLQIHSFDELYIQEELDKKYYVGYVYITQEEQDLMARKAVENAVETAYGWSVHETEDEPYDLVAELRIAENSPSTVLSKFDII